MFNEESFNELCAEHEVSATDQATLQGLFSDESADALEKLIDGEDDFTTDNWRVINAGYIDSVLADELEENPFLIGCFAAWLIADVLDIPVRIVEICQKAEAYEDLGEMFTRGQVEALAREYVAADSYGHHFATYDGHEHEFTFDGSSYYAFRI